MKRALIAALLMILLPICAGASETLDTFSKAFGAGKISGYIGLNFRVDDADEPTEVDDGDIGVAFVELDFESNRFYDFSLGLNFIAVGEVWSNGAWEENGFSNDGSFQRKSLLRNVYLDYDVPCAEAEVLVGRKEFVKSATMDGDAHQGIQITSRDLPRTTLYLAAINRWIDNASTFYDMDGIEKDWRDGDDAFAGASSTTYSVIAEIGAVEGQLALIPFFNHQADVISSYGVTVELEYPVNEDLVFGLEGTYARYDQDSDDPTDEDATSYLVHATVGYKALQVGAGYYVMSDDLRVDASAVGNDTFDPMEEGVYGGDPDDQTIFLDASYSYGPFAVEMILGNTDVDSSATGDDEGATELDLYFTYQITEAFQLDLMFVNVDDDDSGKDYRVYAGGLNMTF